MPSTLTVVMYHYIRELRHTRFPAIKGLNLSDFREQLAHIRRFYSVITAEALLDSITNQDTLPPNPLLLTFDDGFADHFINVFPLLEQAKLQGSFFVPAMPVVEKQMLDVHKIHFILANVADTKSLVDEIFRATERGAAKGLQAPAEYYAQYARPSRFDSAEVCFIKQMLQYALPENVRNAIVADLFTKYVTSDEEAFAAELYLTPDQIRCMVNMGMYFGSHGYSHPWIGHIKRSDQNLEISRSLDFLSSIGAATHRWVMSYPYGDWNAELLELLRGAGCVAAFTTEVGLANLKSDPLLLSRIDANDLPKIATAQACQCGQQPTPRSRNSTS
jgi:peptidoglycan/xylan/chitin deacetylase (PgdA/CDA1 family)